MTSRSYFRSSDGMSVDESEALENGVLKAGYGMRGGALFRDSAGNLTLDDCGQSAYETRLSRAWCDGKPSPLTERRPLPHGRTRTAPLSETQDRLSDAMKHYESSQQAYEARVSSAWRPK